MANDIINLTTISPNLVRFNGAMGQKLWFSYGVLIAVKVADNTENVWITPTFHSVTTSKHVGTVKRWADMNGYRLTMADTEDDLNGWAS